jgi:hypothetical protein
MICLLRAELEGPVQKGRTTRSNRSELSNLEEPDEALLQSHGLDVVQEHQKVVYHKDGG